MEKNIEDDIKKYECQLCGIKFTNQNMLLKHTTKCQKSVRYYCDRPCTIVVQISCQDLNDLPLFCLNLHSIPVIFQMPKEQIWNCQLCDYSTTRKNSVKRHMEIHLGKRQTIGNIDSIVQCMSKVLTYNNVCLRSFQKLHV